ncbi:MAG: tetratricopeptide repeat protein [Bacteroidota bacterium]
MRHLFIVLITVSTFTAFAQMKELDSLRLELKKDISDTLRAKILRRLSFKHLGISTDTGVMYGNQALELAKTLNLVEVQIMAYNAIGSNYWVKGDYFQALQKYEQGLAMAKDHNSLSDEAAFYNNIGNIYYSLGDYSKALEYHENSLSVEKERGRAKQTAQSYGNIGLIYFKLSDYEKAITYHKKSFHISDSIGDKPDLANAYGNLGLVYKAQGDYAIALEYHLKSISLHQDLDDVMGLASSNLDIGDLYLSKKRYDSARLFHERALLISENLGSKAIECHALLGLSDINFEDGQYTRSLNYAKTSLAIAQEISNLELIFSASEILHKAADQLGDYKTAYEAHLIHKEASDSIFNEEQTRKIVMLEANRTFEIEKDSIQFSNEKERLMLDQRIQTQRNTQIGFIVGIILLLIILFVLYKFYKSKSKSNQKLQLQKEEIQHKNYELELMDQAKTRFFANISHELRTPLTLIKGPLKNYYERNVGRLSSTDQRDLRASLKNTEKLRLLVNDILDLSKLDSDKIDVQNEQVEIHSLLMKIFKGFHSLADQLQIDYAINLTELPNVVLSLDRNKLERIVNNLISNALKYTPSKGQVRLIGCRQNGLLSLTVTDTGAGISKDDLPFIFDRYFQSKQPDAPIQGGTGIGLAVAKEYARLMNGMLEVTSGVRKGSNFELSIPFVEVQKTDTVFYNDEPIEDPEIEIENDLSGKKEAHVLIVEDQFEMSQFIQGILEPSFNISIASNGKQALDHLSKYSVDLVISDVMMPEMDGFTLLKRVREHKQLSHLPFIILTALADETNKLHALNEGVDDYLLKPFSSSELITRIKNILSRNALKLQMIREDKQLNPEIMADGFPFKLTDKGKEFVSELTQIITGELENEDFSLEILADRFFLSYSQFSRKVKALTGLSPKQFQQEIVMQKARDLLENGRYGNLTAVAYSVGIRNVTKFRAFYERRFGRNPSEYFNDLET